MTREHKIDTTTYSDMYKDVYGVRPRPVPTFSDVEEYAKELAYLEGMIVEQMEEEAKRQNASSKIFWDRIKKIGTDHSVNVITAIRWDMQAEGLPSDQLEHYLYINDLSWEEIDQIMREIGPQIGGM